MYVYLANYYCSSVELASDGETKRRAFIFFISFFFLIFFLLDHDGGLHMEITSDVSTAMFFFYFVCFSPSSFSSSSSLTLFSNYHFYYTF